MNRNVNQQATQLTVGQRSPVYGKTAVLDAPNGLTDEASISSVLSLNATEETMHSLMRMVKQRDLHTAGHCERLAVSSVALGVAMRLDTASLLMLQVAGYLHDVGKIGIPDAILLKPGKLDAEEWSVMRAHPECGEEICQPMESLQVVLPLIRHHHERWDGGGYPDGLRGTEIPLLARVIQVVDIYDALTNPRPYKHAYSNTRALEILQEETDLGWRDKDIASLFIRIQESMFAKINEARIGQDGQTSMRDSLRNLQKHLG